MFAPLTVQTLIAEQLRQARLEHLQSCAAAEYYAALVNMNALRIARLEKLS